MQAKRLHALFAYGGEVCYNPIFDTLWDKKPLQSLYIQGLQRFLFSCRYVLFLKLCYFFCFVSLIIARISAFEMNS